MVAKNFFVDWGKTREKSDIVKMFEERFNVKIFMKKIFRKKNDKKLMSGEKIKSGNSEKSCEYASDSKKSSEYEEELRISEMGDEKVNEIFFLRICILSDLLDFPFWSENYYFFAKFTEIFKRSSQIIHF